MNRRPLRASRHGHGGKAWQVVRGAAYLDGERIARAPDASEPLLPEKVMSRLGCDVIQFFSDEVAAAPAHGESRGASSASFTSTW